MAAAAVLKFSLLAIYLRTFAPNLLMKIFGEVGFGPGRNHLDFGGDPDSFVDRLSFSRILYHWPTFCTISQQVMIGFR